MRHRWFARPSLIPGPICLDTPAPSQTSSRAPSPPPGNHSGPNQRPPRPTTRRSGQNIFSSLFQAAPLYQPQGRTGIQKSNTNRQKRWSRWLMPGSSSGTSGSPLKRSGMESDPRAGNSKVFGNLLNQVRLFGNEVFGSSQNNSDSGSPSESRRDSLATIESVSSPRLSLRIQEKKVMEQIHADEEEKQGMTQEIQVSLGKINLDNVPAVSETSGKLSQEEDKMQRDLIRGVVDGTLYLHPVCRMSYDFQYCMHRNRLSFTCLAINNFTKDKVSIKFLYKDKVASNLWVQDVNGFRIPVEVMMYRANDNTQLPFYIQDFEDEQFFYIVTATHGQLKKEKKALFESKFHSFDWDAHWRSKGEVEQI